MNNKNSRDSLILGIGLLADTSHLDPLPSENEMKKEVILKELFRRVTLTDGWLHRSPRKIPTTNSDFSVVVTKSVGHVTVEVFHKDKLLGDSKFHVHHVGFGVSASMSNGTVTLVEESNTDLVVRILKEVLIFNLIEMKRERKLIKRQRVELESYRPTYPEPPAYIKKGNTKKNDYPVRLLSNERVTWLLANGFEPFEEGFQMAFETALETEFAENDRHSKVMVPNTCMHKDGYEFQIYHIERTRV